MLVLCHYVTNCIGIHCNISFILRSIITCSPTLIRHRRNLQAQQATPGSPDQLSRLSWRQLTHRGAVDTVEDVT